MTVGSSVLAAMRSVLGEFRDKPCQAPWIFYRETFTALHMGRFETFAFATDPALFLFSGIFIKSSGCNRNLTTAEGGRDGDGSMKPNPFFFAFLVLNPSAESGRSGHAQAEGFFFFFFFFFFFLQSQ